MEKKKKITIILLIVIIIIAIVLGTYKVCSVYLFKLDNTIGDGKNQVIERIKAVEDFEERKKQIDFSVQQNIITQQEADELY